MIIRKSTRIFFAHTSFKWSNLAANNAGVTVVIVGMSSEHGKGLSIISNLLQMDDMIEKVVANINSYIVPGPNLYVDASAKATPIAGLWMVRQQAD